MSPLYPVSTVLSIWGRSGAKSATSETSSNARVVAFRLRMTVPTWLPLGAGIALMSVPLDWRIWTTTFQKTVASNGSCWAGPPSPAGVKGERMRGRPPTSRRNWNPSLGTPVTRTSNGNPPRSCADRRSRNRLLLDG